MHNEFHTVKLFKILEAINNEQINLEVHKLMELSHSTLTETQIEDKNCTIVKIPCNNIKYFHDLTSDVLMKYHCSDWK